MNSRIQLILVQRKMTKHELDLCRFRGDAVESALVAESPDTRLFITYRFAKCLVGRKLDLLLRTFATSLYRFMFDESSKSW